jgi:Endonuclease/Exonuclease/phosphatase family
MSVADSKRIKASRKGAGQFSGRFNRNAWPRVACLIIAQLLPLVPSPALAETVRVTTWNLQTSGSSQDANTNDIFAAARVLKPLNPEFLLLQGVRDWQACALLAQALKPSDYQVIVCSAFPAKRASFAGRREVAILSKMPAYFSWSEPWRIQNETEVEGGYVFATFKFGNRRVGIFSVQFPGAPPRDFTAQQVLNQIGVVRRWEANQADTFIVGCTFLGEQSLSPSLVTRIFEPLQQEGFGNALAGVSSAARVTSRPKFGQPGRAADYLLADSTTFGSNPRVLALADSDHFPVTCDYELDPSNVAATRAILAAKNSNFQTTPNSSSQDRSSPIDSANYRAEGLSSADASSRLQRWAPFWWATVLFVVAFATAGLGKLRRQSLSFARNSPPLIPASFDGRSSFTVIVAPESVSGSASKEPAVPAPRPVIQLEPAAGTTHTESAAWKRRALDAERRAAGAQEAIRRGVVPHFRQWVKQKFAQRLLQDRSQLLLAQQSAARKAIAVDQRLARIEIQIREQNLAYEQRIQELSRELAAAKEENRDLIRSRIAQIKLEMEATRAKLLAPAEEPPLH